MITHIPKGSMCKVCLNKAKSCHHLNFAKMQVVKQHDGYKVVVCTHFRKEGK